MSALPLPTCESANKHRRDPYRQNGLAWPFEFIILRVPRILASDQDIVPKYDQIVKSRDVAGAIAVHELVLFRVAAI